ncbi:MAG: diacylglycerol kinase [Sphingomonas sp.]|uniref:diacylglycerol kinase n=1 Tax=Sphingomonas sp. TaxID=28214 RepID=UPI0025F21C31|nr:diacylglycerol kinase [Sphingomonas sp.]MBY0284831.1 diacylglycerol kinase [Sphingomonas sp.]
MKNARFLTRLRFAVAGIATVWGRERSFRTQVWLGAGALAVVIALRPAPIWIAALVISAALVLTLEIINSALEYLLDHLHPDHHPAIGAAKDAAAGAVLLASIAALAVGGLMVWDTLGWRAFDGRAESQIDR